MFKSRFHLAAVLVLSALASSGVYAEDAAEFQQKGTEALRESQTDPRAIVEAARNFAKASAAYEAAGDTEKAVEMNSYLYWCKKKMNMADIEVFTKGDEKGVGATIAAVDSKKVEASEAQKWLGRATAFAHAKPTEHLLPGIVR